MSATRYDKEYKEKTALLVIEGTKSANQLAKELHINKNTICKWVNETRQNKGLKAPEKSIQAMVRHDDKVKIRALEKQLKEQEETIEILKKAMAFFTKEKR